MTEAGEETVPWVGACGWLEQSFTLQHSAGVWGDLHEEHSCTSLLHEVLGPTVCACTCVHGYTAQRPQRIWA